MKFLFFSLVLVGSKVVLGQQDQNVLDLGSNVQTLFLNPEKVFNISNLNDQCRTHIEAYQSKLVSPLEGPPGLWAIKMLDSTGKLPEGALTGNFFTLGDYKTCLDIDVPDFDWKGFPANGFRGRYMRTLLIPFARNTEARSNPIRSHFNGRFNQFELQPPQHDQESLREGGSAPGSVPILHFGVCLPSSCEENEVTEVALAAIDSVPQLEALAFGIAGFPSHSNADVQELEGIDIFFIVLTTIIGISILIGTSLEGYFYFFEEDSKASSRNIFVDLLLGFSAYSNTKALFTVTPKNTKKDVLTCLNGIRFISMTWVIVGHAYSDVVGIVYPSSNLISFAPKIYDSFGARVLLNAFPSVDSFFLLSGILVTYLTLKELDKTKGRLNWAMFYIHRYLRLTGMYAFVVLFHMSLIKYMDGGPNSYVQKTRSDCLKSWWRNLLYINNLNYRGHYNVETMDEMCIGQTWYLSNDMQMFIVAPIFIYSLWRSRVVGLALAGITTIVSVLVPFSLTITNEWGPTQIFNGQESNFFASNYVLPWCRFSPYIFGILVGYALYLTKDDKLKFKISKQVNALCWLLATGIGIAVIYGLDFSRALTQKPYPIVSSAFYGGFHRLAWGVALGWVVFACSRGYGGWVNDFLSWGPFEPLARLCYNMYLIHLTILMFMSNNQIHSTVVSHIVVVKRIFSVTVLSALVSIGLFVGVELPWGNTEKRIFEQLLGRRNIKSKST